MGLDGQNELVDVISNLRREREEPALVLIVRHVASRVVRVFVHIGGGR